MAAGVVSAFAVLALLLAAVGLYGVIAYSVSQGMRDIGIRMALGAKEEGVLRLVVAGGLLLVMAGALVGLRFRGRRGLRMFRRRRHAQRLEAGDCTGHLGVGDLLAVGDLNGDDVHDVALGDFSAQLWAIDGQSGDVLWSRELDGERYVIAEALLDSYEAELGAGTVVDTPSGASSNCAS